MEYIELVFIGGWLLFLFWDSLSKKNQQRQKKILEEKEIEKWLAEVEPKFSNLCTYPEDWGMRRKFVALRYNYECQKCGRSGWLGFHVHHIHPLSRGGTNILTNLTYLCRWCHENIHPHMVEARNRKEREYLQRKKAWQKEWLLKQKEISLHKR